MALHTKIVAVIPKWRQNVIKRYYKSCNDGLRYFFLKKYILNGEMVNIGTQLNFVNAKSQQIQEQQNARTIWNPKSCD